MRALRLLLLCSLAPAVFAQSADLSVTLTLPSTAPYVLTSVPFFPANDVEATAQFTVKNAGPAAAQNVSIDFGPNASSVSLYGFSCAQASGHYVCSAASMAPGSVSSSFTLRWPQAAAGTVETATVTVSSASPADPDASNNSASANTTVIWQAGIFLENSGTGFPPAAPGNYYNVFAFFTNNGPSPATDLKVTITIPPGADYVSYITSDNQVTCTEPPKGGQGDLVCTAPAFGLLANYEVDAFVRVDPATPPGTVLTFQKTLTSTTATKPVQTDSTSFTVIEAADLHVEISAPASAHAGDSFLTTITVTNNGPGTAVDPRVTYTQTPYLGAGNMTGPAGWSCSYQCAAPTFPPGATATFTVPITIPLTAGAGTVIGKTIADAANSIDLSPNATASATTAITPVPLSALKLTLTGSSDVAHSADPFTFTATITNTSNVDAQNVSLAWLLDSPVIATTCGSVNEAACTFATIPAGATQTVTRTIRVVDGPGTLMGASATVTAANVVYNASNQHAQLSTNVEAPSLQVDLAADIIAPVPVRAGATGTWIYRVENLGPGTATDWQLSVTLPPSMTLAGSSIDGGATCSGLTCQGTSLAPQSHVDLRLSLAVSLSAPARMQTSAAVSTSNFDTHTQNNTTSVTIDEVAPNLSASMTTDKTTAVSGELVTQTLTVTNTGPSAAGILVNVTLPAALAAGVRSSGSLQCTGTTSVRCTGALESGAALTAIFSFRAPTGPGSWKTEADVAWSGFDTVAAVSFDVVPPSPTSDVSLTLDAAPLALETGDTVTYTIGAANLGNAAASNVTVQLDLPPSLAFLSASPQCGGGPLVTCSAGTLNSGASATFTVTARTLAAGTIKVLASESATSHTATATVVVSTPPTPARRRAARH